MQHITIFRDEQLYVSHASACQARNGDVLVAFRQAPLEQIFAHVHPSASVGLIRSCDLGKTWKVEDKTTIFDPGEEYNLNDPSLTTLRDGTIVLTAFIKPCPWTKDKWGDRAHPVRGNSYFHVLDEQKIILCRSFDNGMTWDGPYTVDTSFYGSGSAGVFASVIEMDDGRLLLPITEKSHQPGESVAALLSSPDKGVTWEPYSVITTCTKEDDEVHGFALPSAAAYDDDNMLAAGWSVAASGTTLTSSSDRGKTWSPRRSLDTHGSCMHLCITKSGKAILSYGHRFEPYGIRVLASEDRGKTWNEDHACILRQDGAMRDLGYPWTIQLSDGRLLCVYYFNTADEQKIYYDEKASLKLCEEWKLDPALYTYKEAGLRFIGGTLFTEEELSDPAFFVSQHTEANKAEPTLM